MSDDKRILDKVMKIAICDDEKYDLEKIEHLLKQELQKHNISVYEIDTYLSSNEFLQNNEKIMQYDVIFLDINMPQMNGINVAEKIRNVRDDVLIIFITAFIDYALEGYRLEAIRFLIKDMLEAMMPECVQTIIKKLNLQSRKLEYSFIEGKREIYVDSIMYIESRMHKLFFFLKGTREKSYSIYEKLDNMETYLLSYGFLRIHKSYLINTKYIKKIANYKVEMDYGIVLPIPREKYQRVKEQYYEIKGDMI